MLYLFIILMLFLGWSMVVHIFEGTVALWLVHWTLDWAVWVQALARHCVVFLGNLLS